MVKTSPIQNVILSKPVEQGKIYHLPENIIAAYLKGTLKFTVGVLPVTPIFHRRYGPKYRVSFI